MKMRTSTGSVTTTITEEFNKQTLLQAVPKEAFKKSPEKAAAVALRVAFSIFVAYTLLALLPWYFLPVTWLLAGTAITGLLTIAHDCGHNAFLESEKANNIVGSIAFLPLLYPLESWRLHHNVHHKHADERSYGNHQQKHKKFNRLVNPIFWVYDLGLYFLRYFDLSQFSQDQQTRARVSVISVYAFGAIFFPSLAYTVGVWGIVKFWFVPWLIFHFWKNSLRGYLMGVIVDQKGKKLVHYRYPEWVEFLCFDANFLIPHYLSTSIPTYNTRWVYRTLLSSEWGRYIEEHSWTELLQGPYNTSNGKKNQQFELVKLPGQLKNLIQQINWFHTILLTSTPLLAIYGVLTTEFNFKTYLFAVIYYFCTGLGITAGYHRLWAHKAYDATLPVQLLLLFFGTGAFEGSIRWWCRDHRAHHRYTDTDRDPYSAKKGFLYAHIGWMILKQDPTKIGRADISDLNAESYIRFQHRNYYWLGPLCAFVAPCLISGLGWGDYRGGFLIAGVARLVFVHHATFCVNSLAHYLGTHSFDDKHTPRDSIVTAFLTLGEGYHNFHHEFPHDYRNGIKFYHYDPTKWLIRFLAFFGLTYNLKLFPDNEVQKGYAQMQQKKLDRIKNQLLWGPVPSTLPEWTKEDLEKSLQSGKKIMIIDGLAHDLTGFIEQHPGGPIVKAYIGKDATEVFNGEVYDHSNAARNLLSSFRIARMKNEEEEEEENHHDNTH